VTALATLLLDDEGEKGCWAVGATIVPEEPAFEFEPVDDNVDEEVDIGCLLCGNAVAVVVAVAVAIFPPVTATADGGVAAASTAKAGNGDPFLLSLFALLPAE
jgi:hypothetical protein